MTLEELLEETLVKVEEARARGIPISIRPTVVFWPPGARSIASVVGRESDPQADQYSPDGKY